jgi:hypothetical protein
MDGGCWGADAYRYLEDQVPPRTSSRSRQKAGHANHTPPSVVNLSMNRTARVAPGPPRVLRPQLPLPSPGSSGAATCPADPAPAAQPGAAPEPPRALRLQLPLPSPGSSRAATCPVAPAPAAQPGAAPGLPHVPWRPNGRRAIKVNRYPLSVTIMVTLRGVCASSETPHDKQTPCAARRVDRGGCRAATVQRRPVAHTQQTATVPGDPTVRYRAARACRTAPLPTYS